MVVHTWNYSIKCRVFDWLRSSMKNQTKQHTRKCSGAAKLFYYKVIDERSGQAISG